MMLTGSKRPVRNLALFAALATVGWTSPARAELAHPTLVSTKAAYVVSVPSMPALWNAWKGNSLYAMLNRLAALPEVDQKMREFSREIATIEAALGYKLTGDSLAQIVKSVDVYLQPGEMAGTQNIGAALTISDKEKLGKLLDLAEKAVEAAANTPVVEDTPTPTPAAKPAKKGGAATDGKPVAGGSKRPSKPVNPVSKVEYSGITLKKFTVDDNSQVYYGFSGDVFLVASSLGEIKTLVDRTRGTDPEAMSENEQYKKMMTTLSNRKGELYVSGNTASAKELQNLGSAKALAEFMEQFAPVTLYTASVKITPKEIATFNYGLLGPGSENTIFGKNPGDKPLASLSYLPGSTMLGFATTLLDAEQIFRVMLELAGNNPAEMDQQMQTAEMMLGFSLKKDFFPALGNEMALGLNAFKMSDKGPEVDALLAFKLKDKAKMEKVLSSLERLALNAASSQSESAGAGKDGKTAQPALAFKEEVVGKAKLRYVDSPELAGLTPGYAIDGDYLLIGPTSAAIKSAMDLKSGKGTSLATSEDIKKLAPRITPTANAFEYMNFASIWDTVDAFSGMIPAMKGTEKYLEILKTVQGVAYSSKVEGKALASWSILTLQ